MHRIVITYKDGRVVTQMSNMDIVSLEFVTTELWEHDDNIKNIEIIEP